jgi:hypothetical protein
MINNYAEYTELVNRFCTTHCSSFSNYRKRYEDGKELLIEMLDALHNHADLQMTQYLTEIRDLMVDIIDELKDDADMVGVTDAYYMDEYVPHAKSDAVQKLQDDYAAKQAEKQKRLAALCQK